MTLSYNQCGKVNVIYYLTNLTADTEKITAIFSLLCLFINLAAWSVIQRLHVNDHVTRSSPHYPFLPS
jgi:hypothetical protein